MTPAQWIVKILGIVGDLVAGVISHDEAKERVAALKAADAVVDEVERQKLG